MELIIGPAGESAFATDKDREDAWFRHAEMLLESVNPCTRPWAYWRYERGGKHPRHGTSAVVLEQAGLLTDAEKRLLARWRRAEVKA